MLLSKLDDFLFNFVLSLVCIVHELDFLEDLESFEGDLLEFMETDDVLRRLSVHVD